MLPPVLVGLAFASGCSESPAAAVADAGADADAKVTDASADAGDADSGLVVDTMRMSLPLGDGKYRASPEIGHVYSCQRSFMGGMGAQVDGPWIDIAKGTFDFTAKTVVQGAVTWPHTFSATVTGATRNVTSNGLPEHKTGTFPIAANDPAYAYDRNPNTIAEQARSWALPANPSIASLPGCLPGGPIGILLTGAVLFNALDADGRDALAHEAQDACQAHPERSGAYHYHSATDCIADPGTGHSALLGYALDGFGIYGLRGEGGKVLTNADLDTCHGHKHSVAWDGSDVPLYHYHATYEYPYTLGCFKGTPVTTP